MAEADFVEGFICPLCRQDLQSFQHLEAHFREEHRGEGGRSKLKTNFMSFLDKAKSSFTKKPSYVVEDGASAVGVVSGSGTSDSVQQLEPVTNVSGIDPLLWPTQELGASVDYTTQFISARNSVLAGTVAETNRLVIRLEKLFRILKDSAPKTSKQMKSLEQSIVPWKKDEDEKRCGQCGRGFGVRRRRHHCRLCGGIVCKQCSHFMTLGETYPVLCDSPDYHSLAPSPSLRRKKLQLKKTDKDSADQEEEPLDEIRMCSSCKKLIDRRLFNLQSLETPIISALYDKMHMTMAEADRMAPSFIDMADSLLEGEFKFSLETATRKRQDLLRVFESVDSISKQILKIGSTDESVRGQKLSRSIRVFASNYLQDNLLTLPSLPTNVQLRQIREDKEREAEERVKKLERERELQRQKEAAIGAGVGGEERKGFDKLLDLSKDISSKMSVGFKKDSSGIDIPRQRNQSSSGWMASTSVSSMDSHDDPFAVHKQQLLAYIKQAREAKRMDEVAALEQSLRDIEVAMHQQTPLSYGISPPDSGSTMY